MRVLFPIIIFLSINYLLVSLNKKLSFSLLFPVTLMGSTLIMYIFGLIDQLKIGFYFIAVLALLGIFYFIYSLFSHKRENIHRYFDLGFFAVIIIYIIVCFIDFRRGFNFVDEFSFWGASVEENIRLGKLYVVSESNLSYSKDYFPFYQLFETLWCYASGGFGEAYCYRAISFFSLSLFAPLFDLIKNSRVFKSISLIITIILSGFVVSYTNGMYYNTLFYNSIYIDWHIAFLMAYCLYFISLQNNKYNINLLFGFISLILTKQASVVYWLILLVLFLIVSIKNRKENKINKSIILMIIIPIIFYFSWITKVNLCNAETKFTISDFQFGTIINYFNGSLLDYRINIIDKFVNAIVFEPVISGLLKFSYLAVILLITVLMFFVELFYKRKNGYIFVFGYFIGSIIFAYVVLLAYLYSFDYEEAIGLVMYSRYVILYVVFGIIYLLFVLTSFVITKTKFYMLISILYLSLFISKNTIENSMPAINYTGAYNDNYYRFNEILSTIDDDSKVIIIFQNDPVKLMALKYYGIENENKLDFIDIYDGNTDGQIGTPFWKNDLLNLFKQYDYIYICDIDDTIYDLWNSISNVPCKVDHMYKIEDVTDEECKLSLLYEDF